jgi:hypothetical protein
MSNISYVSIIERYQEFKSAIQQVLLSILSGINEEPMFHSKETQCKAMSFIGTTYPFVDILYVLDSNGIQISDNITRSSKHCLAYKGKGIDRGQRPYFLQAKNSNDICITEPYLSTASRKLCISAAVKRNNTNEEEYLVLDCDLEMLVDFLMGDTARRRFQPLFKFTYSLIVTGLFLVVASLIYAAFSELSHILFKDVDNGPGIKPFGVIIFLTLALAVFDLGKTTLEEEVLMHKDIFRHSSTRRTITRFTAAILIAVSIESLLLMFKAAVGEHELLENAVYMMIATVGLLIGLGIYVFLGAKAERTLLKIRNNRH